MQKPREIEDMLSRARSLAGKAGGESILAAMSRVPILRTAGIWLPFSGVMFYPAIVALVFWTLFPIVKKSGYGFRTSKPTFT